MDDRRDAPADRSPDASANPRTDPSGLDTQADALLRHIESQTGSMYAIHVGQDAEELDPGNIHADELNQAGALDDGLAHVLALDEPDPGLDAAASAAQGSAGARASGGKGAGAGAGHARKARAGAQDAHGIDPARRRRRLKRALIAVLVLLIVALGAVAALVWHGNSAGDAGAGGAAQTGASSLAAGSAEDASAGSAALQEVDAGLVPRLSRVFGMKLARAKEELGARASFEEKPQKTSDTRVSAMRSLAEGSYVAENGAKVADIGLGLDKSGRVVYAYVLYNLDEIGVASAGFSELVTDGTVELSVLRGLGAGDATELGAPELEVDDEDKDEASYRGSTGSKAAPQTWQLAVTYTYASGATVARTLLAELY